MNYLRKLHELGRRKRGESSLRERLLKLVKVLYRSPAGKLVVTTKQFIRRGYGRSYTVEHSEPTADNTPGQEANKSKSSERGEAGRSTSTNRKFRQRRLTLHRRRIAQLKERLYALGFTERALEDLEYLAADDSKPVLQRLAAWELSLWHANQGSEEHARLCLEFLPAALQGENDPVRLRQAAIIEAECHDVLGEVEAARQTVSCALASEAHADLFLAHASLEATAPARIEWINKALKLHGISEITYDFSADKSLFDFLKLAQDPVARAEASSDAKVSIIIPVYNAESTIRTALDSVLSQTWANLEVLIVDDCSADATVSVVEDYARRDSRVHLINTEANGGPYVARNLALRVATGEFVTCHDADDWSHPEKIEKQVQHLLDDPSVMGNTSQQARTMPDLKFYRRGNPGYYVASNFSSLMFRRDPVMEAVGYWDHVRFGADTEYKKRITKVFGDGSVVDVPTGPLSFIRQSSSSLTGDEAFGLYKSLKGARREYRESYIHFNSTAKNLRLDFLQEERSFAVPEPMWPIREVKGGERRHFDVILVSDFRVPEGFNVSNVEEIKAQKQVGLRTGLVQMSQYGISPTTTLEQSVREQLDGDRVQMLVYGEKVSCDTLIVRHPPILQEWQEFVPDVEAGNIHVVVDQAPMSSYDEVGELSYSISRGEEHVQRYFGKPGLWHPVGPSIRKALQQHHEQELRQISLADEDWSNAAVHEGGEIMAKASGNRKSVQKSGYWAGRTELMYYRYVDFMVRALAADARSLIDVGSADAQYIENFDWIQKRNTLDIKNPYNSDNIQAIEMNFFDFEPEEKYDFATCLQVLEHVPDAGAFAKKLFQTAHRVLISVPYLWEEGSTSSHVHDPVDLDKLIGWTGREPDYYIVVQEPLSKRQRLIAYYHHPEAEKLNVKEARQKVVAPAAHKEGRSMSLVDDEPLLYRFGFVCVPASEVPSGESWKAIQAKWKPTQIRDFLVLAHPEVPVTPISDSALLIGHAFAVGDERPARELLEIAVADGSDLALHDTLDLLSGRFVLITSHGGGRIYHDAVGSRTVFYRLSQPPCIASHSGLIAELFGATIDPLAEAIRQEPEYLSRGVTYLPGDLSVHDGVRALAPNNYYDIASGRPVRYWPRAPRVNTTLDQFHARADVYFNSFAAYLSNRLTPVLGVTPGIDSRTIIAAFRHHNLPMKYVTWKGVALPEEDLPVAERMASYLQGEHSFLPHEAQKEGETFDHASDLARKNVGHFRGGSRTTAYMYQTFEGQRDLVFVRGYGAEIIRGFYNTSRRPMEETSIAELTRLYNSGLNIKALSERYLKLVSEAVSQFMSHANYEGLDKFGYDINDLYYWESRMGMWGASMHNEMDPAMLSMTGFNDRRLFENAFGLEPSERLTDNILLDLTRRHDEGLAMFPVNPSRKRPDSKARGDSSALPSEKQLREKLKARSKRNENLEKRLKERESELKEEKKKYREALRERDRFRRLYVEIRQSRMWRYTEPMRRVISVVRTLTRR